MSTPEARTAIRSAIRAKGNTLGLTFSAIESCVDLGIVLNGLGADQAESIRRACQMADVIAKESEMAL